MLGFAPQWREGLVTIHDGPATPHFETAFKQHHDSGRLRENSDRHHSRFSAVFVALLPGCSKDRVEIIETALGSLDSQANCRCNSSQQIQYSSLLISQCNAAGICSVATEMPTSPWHRPLRISSGPCTWPRRVVASTGPSELTGLDSITRHSQVRSTAAMPCALAGRLP